MCFDVCLHLEKTDNRCQPCGLVLRPYFLLVRLNEKLYQHFQGSSEATSVHLIKNFGEHAPRHLAHTPL